MVQPRGDGVVAGAEQAADAHVQGVGGVEGEHDVVGDPGR